MKFRKGFVSNSSSSSFVIGIANVGDNKGLGNYTFDPDYWDDGEGWLMEPPKKNEDGSYTLKVESFMYDVVSCKARPGDNLIVGYRYGDLYGDEDGYIDYDIDWDDLSEYQKDLAERVEQAGGEVMYGAGRDG